jgi:cleavage and polyadenylation specificity factor subunit 1
LSESSSSYETFVPCHPIVEMRFFFAGPALENGENTMKMSLFRPFCLVLYTAKGDFHLYSLAAHSFDCGPEFSRVPLTSATRPSSEEGRHRAKLYRRGILSSDTVAGIGTFRYNSLVRFHGISGRDGLFSSTARPFWVLADRGMLVAVPHKMRHLAAGSSNPIKAFCSSVWGEAFVTVHERIGRVGSQRLTVYKGLSSISSPDTFFPGGGSCVTKVPFGVTVRRIIFLEDVTISSLAFPLFVMIISRDFEASQSHLNDDGLTPEERNKIKAEKEAEKTRRQVEADLAGVDHIEQEWVEEIERDDYFEVKIHLGGAPPIPKSTYEVWLVNGNGWKVLDRYELGECDKALSLLAAPLTEVVEESKRAIGEEVSLNATFVAVGTGYVDQDGEDVSSKGKVMLFEVARRSVSNGGVEGEDKDAAVTGITASINLVYEKDMLMGPVTSLSCLTCDNTTRLVVGAGAEVTIEQWNGEKLTQVGFFHAHMHVLDVKIFKNFFLLSDAYDSMYLLVWRESDKSLTLLAKDYEPTTIYCAGMLSRGSSIVFVCHDERENLQFFQYAPKDEASRGGNKLVCRADFHLG